MYISPKKFDKLLISSQNWKNKGKLWTSADEVNTITFFFCLMIMQCLWRSEDCIYVLRHLEAPCLAILELSLFLNLPWLFESYWEDSFNVWYINFSNSLNNYARRHEIIQRVFELYIYLGRWPGDAGVNEKQCGIAHLLYFFSSISDYSSFLSRTNSSETLGLREVSILVNAEKQGAIGKI